MKDLYTHPIETWDEEKCAKRAKFNPVDAYGNRRPFPGWVSFSNTAYPMYGQTRYYNGGCIREGEHYAGERVPLPIISNAYEFVYVPHWGIRLVKK